jgi:valyl-tRNA synthetase
MELPKRYNPKEVENKIYKLWEKGGFFTPRFPKGKLSRKKPFVITLPPPNVTGGLHAGHAMYTIEDILIRYHKLKGEPTLFLPGFDHASIAVEYLVSKQLAKEGKSKKEIGRKEFLKRAEQFANSTRNYIREQLKKLGFALDWSREVYTIDKVRSEAVKEAFLRLYKKGLIYKGERIINWCPSCQTVVSDLEQEHKEEKGKLYFVKYGPITIATTRPETMFADVAVAIFPKHKKYKKLVGKQVPLPLTKREISVIEDKAVDPEFGTGALKITPTHDPLDFEIGKRHKLPMNLLAVGEDGRLTKLTGNYAGLSIKEGRKRVVADLEKAGLLKKIKEISHTVSHCEKCGSVTEPRISKQWFLKIESLAKEAIKVVKKGKIKIIPKRFERVYFHWLENIHDWCISRQLWWGHRIPVWYCENSEKEIKSTSSKMGFANNVVSQVFDNKTRTYRLREHNLKAGDRVAFENSLTGEIFGTATITKVQETTVGKINLKDKKHWKTYNNVEELISAFKLHYPKRKINIDTPVWIYTFKFKGVCPPIVEKKELKKCPFCKSGKLKQETDILDTWFSSSLWPISVFSWPKETRDFNYFYPTTVRETGYDILFFWVAREIMMCLEMTKKIPFKTVYLHGLVRDKKGRKFSKTKGVGFDPLEVIEEYGADALRMAVVVGNKPGNDLRIEKNKVVAYRNFANKIWNASRFVLTNTKIKTRASKPKTQHPDDKWILKELKKTTRRVTKLIERYRFDMAAQVLYQFFWHTFCDRYLEMTKERKKEATPVLIYTLLTSLKLLHPFIPFITEEIYQKLPLKNKRKSLMLENWPK